MIWSINQHISHRISFGRIVSMLNETFNIQLYPDAILRFRSILVEEYKEIYEEIRQNMINGFLIHTDETQINVKGLSSAYVWVFANIDSVFYKFRSTRESEFLGELLQEFQGVLVSDFYAGYDSLPCAQ